MSLQLSGISIRYSAQVFQVLSRNIFQDIVGMRGNLITISNRISIDPLHAVT